MMGGEWIEPYEWKRGDLITDERLNRVNQDLYWLKQQLGEIKVDYWNKVAQQDVIRPLGVEGFGEVYNVLVLTSTNPNPGLVLRDSAGVDRAGFGTFQDQDTMLWAINTEKLGVGRYGEGAYSWWHRDGSIWMGSWATGSVVEINCPARLMVWDNFRLIPLTDNTGSLGAGGIRWATAYITTIYTGDLNLVRRGKSGGDWTIREGPDGLYARNNRTGKLYRFRLEEVKPEHI